MNKPSIEKYLQLEEDLRFIQKSIESSPRDHAKRRYKFIPHFYPSSTRIRNGDTCRRSRRKTGLWSVHASSMEEFMVKNLIQSDKIPEFQSCIKVMTTIFVCLSCQN